MTMLTSIYNKAWVDARPVGKLIWAILAVVGVADAFRYFFLLSCNFVFIFFFLFGHMLRRHPLYPMQMLCLSVCLFIYMYNMPTLLLFFFLHSYSHCWAGGIMGEMIHARVYPFRMRDIDWWIEWISRGAVVWITNLAGHFDMIVDKTTEFRYCNSILSVLFLFQCGTAVISYDTIRYDTRPIKWSILKLMQMEIHLNRITHTTNAMPWMWCAGLFWSCSNPHPPSRAPEQHAIWRAISERWWSWMRLIRYFIRRFTQLLCIPGEYGTDRYRPDVRPKFLSIGQPHRYTIRIENVTISMNKRNYFCDILANKLTQICCVIQFHRPKTANISYSSERYFHFIILLHWDFIELTGKVCWTWTMDIVHIVV